MTRSYYSNSIDDFLKEDELSILGKLSSQNTFNPLPQQKIAWQKQIQILKNSLPQIFKGRIFFEFGIPRMGKRADNILIISDLIFVLEFKVGDDHYQKHSIEQVVDYCLDLQNFHEGSHNQKLVPILISTKAPSIKNSFKVENNLFEPIKANEINLRQIISTLIDIAKGEEIDIEEWENSKYKPTPTIIEASQALYRGHNVTEISRNDAGAINLSKTTDCINSIIEFSKTNSKKAICFLTGVPGAGKTLAGLNIANERRKAHEDENAVFLSGNGPLVYVLREALVRDEVLAAKERGVKLSKKESKIKANAFIQNIHHFRDEYLISKVAPSEKVVVFDEAQRAWTEKQASSFMKKRGHDFFMSEPSFLLDVMNRHSDYCTIVCLIGGGQEINTGEAGLTEWMLALQKYYSNWDVYYSSLISNEKNYIKDEYLKDWLIATAIQKEELHLSVCNRSFRTEKVSNLVQQILDINPVESKETFNLIKNQFPIFLTRNLEKAKGWLKERAKGSERIGIVASSGGKRLRPYGINVDNIVNAEEWFLNSSEDVRSSQYLELVATEFDIQGLEIDYVCVAWDINFYYENGYWKYQVFEGTRWKELKVEVDKSYLLNSYRVLLTRARQGVIIFIPSGEANDQTRPQDLYDQIFEYLKSCGIPAI